MDTRKNKCKSLKSTQGSINGNSEIAKVFDYNVDI